MKRWGYCPEHGEGLEKYMVTDLIFSRNIYQLDLDYKDAVFEPFLSILDDGTVRDHFCSCDDMDDICVHQLLAYNYIMQGDKPLHVVYVESLWNVLMQKYAEECGFDAEVYSSGNSFSIYNRNRALYWEFFDDAMAQRCRSIFFERNLETDKNSLKFSNLSDHDKKLWREGRPTFELAYELSYWSDLAKQLFMEHRQDGFNFDFDLKGGEVSLNFHNSKLHFKVDMPLEDFEALIPSFDSFGTGFRVYSKYENIIENIIYDDKKALLKVSWNEEVKDIFENLTLYDKIKVGSWYYLPRQGFFSDTARDIPFKGELQGGEVAHLLNNYRGLLEGYLDVSREVITVKYNLAFDEYYNLVIGPYLFQSGDIEGSVYHLFGEWVFLPEKGFHRIETETFLGMEKVIIRHSHVDRFVEEHRPWLNNYIGFNIHRSYIDRNLFCQFIDGDLHFILASEKGDVESYDFGHWYYISGEGFYSKSDKTSSETIYEGLIVKGRSLASFIKYNEEELLQVNGFFANDEHKVLKSGLIVSTGASGTIDVNPVYKVEGYTIEGENIYGNYLYLEGEGFLKIPTEYFLPDKYRQPDSIPSEKVFSFVSYELEELRPYIIEADKSLQMPEKVQLKVISSAVCNDSHLCRSKMGYASEHGLEPLENIWQAIHNNEHILFSSAGLLNVDDQRFHWLRELVPENFIDGELFLTGIQLVKICALECDLKGDLLEQVLGKSKKYSLKGLKCSLRQYQTTGLEWLWQLYCHGLGGLLCDDMGLGKTHQGMALMASILNNNPEGCFIIVCPTSVLYHWKYKLEEYLPAAGVTLYYGSKRDLKDFKGGILLTSYGIFRREHRLFGKHNFEVAILDEIQAAKNSASQLHRSLKSLKAQTILGLTGTPIENSLTELHALLEIVLPGYMPNKKIYKELFINPIERHNDEESKSLLKKYIKPFILRRLKDDVLSDLPKKSVSFEYCDMAEQQQQLYQNTLSRSRDNILGKLEGEEEKVPYMHIFALLSYLKQICNHPALFLKDVDNYKEYSSGKWNLFLELLEQARASGQKVVVFSHYLGMLDIMEDHLKEQGIVYASIRGATQKRHEQIFKFNNDCHCEVFLGSLQAVGLGIDLTAASVVIHYDRWWSAAKENQATDRVHRIGQRRGVQVFKLITKDSFEERIHSLISRKERLMEDILDAGDQNQLHRFNRQELMELLRNI